MFGFCELSDFPERVGKYYNTIYVKNITCIWYSSCFSSTHDILLTVKKGL
jgi:hypothetical protein